MKLEQIDGKNRLVFDPEGELERFPFEGEPIFDIPDTVYIYGKVYAKTEEAFRATDKAARENRYEDSITKPEDRHKRTYFRLDESRAAECGSCNQVISQLGVRCHGHKCEHCGEPTFLEYTRDGAITFQFIKNGEKVGRTALSFRIFGYREHADKPDELLLFPTPILGDYAPPRHEKRGWNGLRQGFFGVRDIDEAQMILEEARDLYTRETVRDPLTDKNVEILVVQNRTPHMITQESLISTYELVGQIHNHRLIKVYGGQRYGEWDNLPIPDSFDLTKRYIGKEKHSLAEPDIHEVILHAAGQVSRTDYYHQDGSTAIGDVVYKRMTDFVAHFVDADIEEWSVFLSNAPKDGPGLIRSLAAWCAAMSDGQKRAVRCEPNMWNAIEGMGKIISGQQLTYQKSVAMTEGAETKEADELAFHMLQAFQERQAAEKAAFGQRLTKWFTGNTSSEELTDSGEDEEKNRAHNIKAFRSRVRKWIKDIGVRIRKAIPGLENGPT